jgi:hypothetical protein
MFVVGSMPNAGSSFTNYLLGPLKFTDLEYMVVGLVGIVCSTIGIFMYVGRVVCGLWFMVLWCCVDIHVDNAFADLRYANNEETWWTCTCFGTHHIPTLQLFDCVDCCCCCCVCGCRYKWWFRNVDLRWFVGIASAIVAVLSLIPLILVFRINQKWGISDLAFSLGDEALVGEWATSKGVLWYNIERCCWLLVGWLLSVGWLAG